MNDFLFDTHAHLDLCPNFDEIVREIEERKIYTIAVTNLPVLYKRLKNKLKSRYIRPALGFHPELIGRYEKFIPEMWEDLPNARFVGEVGIDLKVAKESESLQVDFFTELIARCNHYGGKVLTIHSRGAEQLVVDIIGNNFNGKVILHWYSGGERIMQQAISNGAYFSINSAMTESQAGQRIIGLLPLNRILLESDAPFIKYKGKCVDSLCINFIVEKLALLKNVSYAEMLSQLYLNFKSILK